MRTMRLHAIILVLALPVPSLIRAQGQTASVVRDSAEVIAVERRWADADQSCDVAALERMLSPNLTFVHTTGATDDRRGFLEKVTGCPFTRVESRPSQVRVMGDAALVIGALRLTPKGGGPGQWIPYTRVYVREPSGWLLLAHQGTDPGPPRATGSRAVDETEIRAARERSNAAIARHDVSAMTENLMPDVREGWGGSAGHLDGRDSTRAAIARTFADSAFITAIRTPERIDVSDVSPEAAEVGRWVVRRQRADGVEEVSGRYAAKWRKTADGWRLHTETFTSIACRGSARCAPAR